LPIRSRYFDFRSSIRVPFFAWIAGSEMGGRLQGFGQRGGVLTDLYKT
jgi:hypothetical protein